MNVITEVNGEEVELEITYEYVAGSQGLRGDFGQPIEPDEPPQVNVITAEAADGNDYWDSLTPLQQEKITNQILALEANK